MAELPRQRPPPHPAESLGRETWFAAFEAARDAMVMVDDGRHVVHANPAACRLFGLDAGALVGRRIDEFAPAGERHGYDEMWASSSLKGHHEGEYELCRDGGSRVAVQATMVARVGPSLHLWILCDVTDRRAKDELLEQRRQELVHAQALGGFGSWRRDLETDAVEWSDEMHRICGLEPATVTRFEQLVDCVHPDDRARLQAVVGAALEQRGPFIWEYRVVRPDGAVRVIESRGEVVVDEHDRLQRLDGTGQDITERRQAELDRENLSTVLDTSDDAITACTRDATFSIWNHGAEKLFGHTAAEAIGQPFDLILPPGARAFARENFERVLRGERIHPEDADRITKDGRIVVVSVTLSAIRDTSGEITGVAAIGRDVTEQKRTVMALAEAHAQAVEASRLKSQFMANMNHELRTPLNGVIGLSGLLHETPLNDLQREYVEALQLSGDTLMSVIEDILDFSKIEAGKLELSNEPFELRTLVEDVASMVAVAQPNRAVEVIASVDPRLPHVASGDAKRIRQVLTNLTNNAVKFTEVGEVAIVVTGLVAADDELALRFEVVDTGIGIDTGVQESIFDSFAQADGTTTRRYGGTGLGLTIAKQLVSLMGGEIGVRSTVGEGSTFWFTLPLRAVHQETPFVAHRALNGVRVLVVDDKATNRGILEQQLAAWGMSVETAPDGPTALAALRRAAASERAYDLALLDFKMPGMGGGELAVAIKAEPPLRPVTLVMMVASRDTRAASTLTELEGVITKPLRLRHLHDELSRVLGASSGQHATPSPDQEADAVDLVATHKVLVAEDNPVNQLVATRLLERRGCAVDVAVNGRQALEMHEQTRYDAIFMDCQMPELDGYEATREIRRREGNERHTPIIAMTASTMPGDTQRCLAAGMDYYCGKPISSAGLDYILNQALAGANVPSATA